MQPFLADEAEKQEKQQALVLMLALKNITDNI